MSNDEENIVKVDKPAEEKPSVVKQVKKKRKIFRKIFLALFLLFFALIIIVQTSFFKNWLLHFGVDKVNEMLAEKDSRLYVERIEGSIFRDFQLINISLTVKKDTMFKLDKLELAFDLSGLARKKVTVNNLILDKPQINFTKIRDKNDSLMWNLDYLLKSDKVKEEDTTTSEFKWNIYADNVEIRNGAFRSLDLKQDGIPIRDAVMKKIISINRDSLDVTNLNIQLSGSYLPDEKNVSIKNVSFNTNSDLNIHSLSLDAFINKNDLAEVKNLKLVTDKSNVNINIASMENLNPLKKKIDYLSFEKNNFVVDLLVDKFDADDLTFFLPSINFLDGKVYLNLKAKGNYADFNVGELQVSLPNGSALDIKGRVKNLHDPSKLYFDVECKNAVINPKDEKENIPGLKIPDYGHLGVVTANFKFKGEPLKFNAEAEVKSSAGNAEVKGYLDITQKELVYDGKASTTNLDIGKIVKDEKLRSSITGDFMVEGRGVDYKTMVNKINYNIKNTTFYDQRIESSSGTINANSGSIDLNVDYKSTTGYAKVDGNVLVRDLNNLVYNLKGNVSNLDISSLTKKAEDKSNLNFTFDVNGSGTDPDNISGKLDMQLQKSMLADYIIPETPIKINFFKNDTARFVTLVSDLADVNVSGRFKFLEIPSIVTNNIDKISDQISKNLKMDTLGFSHEPVVTDFRIRSYANADYDTDISYTINIKSLLPLQLILKDSTLVFKCDIRGRLLHNNNSLVFSTSGRFEDFRYGDSTLLFKRSVVRVFLKDDFNSKLPLSYVSDVNVRFKDIYTGGVKFDTLDFDFRTSTAKPEVRIFTKMDSTKGLYTKGFVDLSLNNYSLQLDTMSLLFDSYSLANTNPIVFNYMTDDTGYSKHHFDISGFRLSDGNQRLNLNGVYSFDGNSNLTLSADKINIAKFQKYLNPGIDKDLLVSGNVRRIKLSYKGTFENPELNLEANTDFLSAQKMKLGRVDAIVDYKNNLLVPQVAFYNPNNAGLLTIDGSLPYDNPLVTNQNNEERKTILESPVNLKINAKDFQIKILEQFIPVISDLRGKMNGNIDISGIVKEPVLTGGLDIKKGTFTFDMTGVNYNFNTDITTEKQKLNFQKFEVTHKSAPNKIMKMGGYIDLTNLTLNDMELRLSGQAKLLDENVNQNIMSIYGSLFGQTGLTDIVLKGNPESLLMTGDLNLTEGRILIVPQLKVAYNIYEDNFTYKVLLDSNLTRKDTSFVTRYTDSLSNFEKSSLDPFDSYFYRMSDSTAKKTVPSNFKYYISVKTLKDIFAKLIIEEKSGQEFSGNIAANITFDNYETPSFATRGRVDIGENSYYKFYKSFKADGYALFTGDVTNPELYIKGDYTSSSVDPNNNAINRKVEVKIDVTGNVFKMNPIKWEVLSDGNPVGGSNPDDDAISFLLFGRFKDELNADQRLSLVSNLGANVGTSYASAYLSNFVNTYLPFILKTDISYKDSQTGSFAENTDIRVTAQLAGATVIFGGQILRDLSNTNFLIEYPLNNIFGIHNISQNLIIQLERYIDPFSQNSILSSDNRTGGALLYRIKF
ncbi:MAG: translocation/assembly module TamB domain-containing protein [Ignavibacteriae bacterium]|nr:translocation/assembly module TamB domain-containing protein [Ignavibacteriota bacterium]